MTREQIKNKIKELKEFHKQTFEVLKEKNPRFSPKMVYKMKDGKTYLSMFDNELDSGEKIYFEKINRDYDYEDDARTLYVVDTAKINKKHVKKYKSSNGYVLYRVPIKYAEKVEINPDVLVRDYGKNLSVKDMSIYDFACLILKVPNSSMSWLNSMISVSLNKDTINNQITNSSDDEKSPF